MPTKTRDRLRCAGDNDRNRAIQRHVLGHAAEESLADRRALSSAHDDRIDIVVFCNRQNSLCRIAVFPTCRNGHTVLGEIRRRRFEALRWLRILEQFLGLEATTVEILYVRSANTLRTVTSISSVTGNERTASAAALARSMSGSTGIRTRYMSSYCTSKALN